LINVPGCDDTLKEYAHILQDDPHHHPKQREFVSKAKDVQGILKRRLLTAKLSPLQDQAVGDGYSSRCSAICCTDRRLAFSPVNC
jgi:hypothetical protein